MKKIFFASAAAFLALSACAARQPAPAANDGMPTDGQMMVGREQGMHKMPNGEMMMDHDMPGMHQMPDGSMMKDDDVDEDLEKDGGMMAMGDMPCCKKGPDGGMECPMMKGMGSMDHDDMTMGDMVDMLKGKTGDELDAAFLEGMIPHHQGAVDMANLILKNAKHEELRQMARDIIDAQQKEIDMMEGWQKAWGYAK